MLRKGPYRVEMPETSTKVWRVWAGPHHGATYSSRSSDHKICGSELDETTDCTTANQYKYNNRGSREYGEQSMTIDVQVSISIGKRQRLETNSCNHDGEYEDRKKRICLRDSG